MKKLEFIAAFIIGLIKAYKDAATNTGYSPLDNRKKPNSTNTKSKAQE